MQIAVEREDRRLDVDRHRLPRRERRRAADLVAAVRARATSGVHGSTLLVPIARARFLVLTWRSPCIRTISGSALLVLHHQRLDDRVLVDAELARRLGRAAVLDVVVDVLAEGDAVRGAAHCVAGVSLTCASSWPWRRARTPF